MSKNYYREHRNTCQLCHCSALDLLRACLSHDPVSYWRVGYTGPCGHWLIICHNCWPKVLAIPDLRVIRLYRNTWAHSLDMFGSDEDTRNYVSEYISRYPMRNYTSPENWMTIKAGLHHEK